MTAADIIGVMPPRHEGGQIARDPVSELLDGAARRLLERAYARPGIWVETRLANPTAAHVMWAAGLGINLLGPDPAAGGTINARSAWGRAFVRALYHQHRWYGRPGPRLGVRRRMVPNTSQALQVEVGRMRPGAGRIPAGRAVRVIVRPGGRAARAAVQAMPQGRRIYDRQGRPAGAWADPGQREYLDGWHGDRRGLRAL